MWIRTPEADYFYYERFTSPFHQAHIVLHLAGAMLLSDDVSPGIDYRLVPGLSPHLVNLMLGDEAQPAELTETQAEDVAILAMRRIDRSLSRSAAHRAFRQLQALRTVVVDAVPECAGSSARPETARPQARLHRTIVEIRDAALALRPYRDPWTAAAAGAAAQDAQLTDQDTAAAVEAAVLAEASHAKKDGRPACPSPYVTGPAHITRADLRGETEWLLKVAQALADHPLRHRPECRDRPGDHEKPGAPFDATGHGPLRKEESDRPC